MSPSIWQEDEIPESTEEDFHRFTSGANKYVNEFVDRNEREQAAVASARRSYTKLPGSSTSAVTSLLNGLSTIVSPEAASEHLPDAGIIGNASVYDFLKRIEMDDEMLAHIMEFIKVHGGLTVYETEHIVAEAARAAGVDFYPEGRLRRKRNLAAASVAMLGPDVRDAGAVSAFTVKVGHYTVFLSSDPLLSGAKFIGHDVCFRRKSRGNWYLVCNLCKSEARVPADAVRRVLAGERFYYMQSDCGTLHFHDGPHNTEVLLDIDAESEEDPPVEFPVLPAMLGRKYQHTEPTVFHFSSNLLIRGDNNKSLIFYPTPGRPSYVVEREPATTSPAGAQQGGGRGRGCASRLGVAPALALLVATAAIGALPR